MTLYNVMDIDVLIHNLHGHHAGVEVAPGKGEKVVNLIVTCERDVAHLNFSTSGLKVSSIRLAQHCRVLGEYDSSDCEVSSCIYSKFMPHIKGGMHFNYVVQLTVLDCYFIGVLY